MSPEISRTTPLLPALRRWVPGLLALLVVATAQGHGGDHDRQRQPQTESRRLAKDLTAELLAVRNGNARAGKAAPANAGAHLQAIVQERHDLMRLLADADPAAFLELALPGGIRAAFPRASQALIEHEVAVEGELEVIHVDMPGDIPDRYWYLLQTDAGQRKLHFAGKPTRLLSGSRVKVRGVALDGDIVLASGGAGSVVTLAAALPNTIGVQNTLVILVNFSDQPNAQPYTPAQATQVVLGDTSSYDMEVSYQQTSLSGTVTPWYTIAQTSTTCDYGAIATQADAAATAGGYVLSNYRRKVYAFPGNSCTWWGLGTVGGNPSKAWINSKFGFVMSVVAHEMGHNFGLYHSHSLDCGSEVVGDAGCTSTEYGDVLDVMGGSPNNAAAHFNAFQKERLGWLGAGASPPLTTVQSGAGQYSIGNIEAPNSATPRALKVGNTVSSCGVAPSEWYYIEKREAVGYDGFIGNYTTTLPNSVVIHRVTEGDPDSSYLLDMSPQTTTWHDVGLVSGTSFTDPVTGLVIQPVSVGAGFANVNVSYGPASCANKPRVTLSPAGTIWRVGGEQAALTATVTNNDSCGCPSTAFAVAASVPAGWSASSGQTAALAPGASAQVPLNVQVGAAATAGFYPVPVTATSTVNATKSGAATAQIAVVQPIVLTNGVAVSPISAAKDAETIYSLQVPAGKTSLAFTSTGGTGDADLYVRMGTIPSRTSYTCVSGGPTNAETCSFNSPAAGTWYVLVHAYSAVSGMSLVGQYLPADPIVPTLSVADVALSEGNAGSKNATFTLSLSQAAASTVTVDVATAPGTASPGSDYTSVSTSGLSIPAGQTSASFNVPVLGDTVVEGNETFTVNLSNPSNATISRAQALGRITNDDLATLSVDDASVLEGNAGTVTATFMVRLSAPMPTPVYYNIATSNGSAIAGSDYVARSLSGRFIDAGRTSQVFEVSVLGDGTVEPNETFSVTLSSVSGAVLGRATATGTVLNDDGVPVAPTAAPSGPAQLKPAARRSRPFHRLKTR